MTASPRLGYTIVYVADVAAALQFYERAFGLKRRFLHDSGLYGELETGATALAFAGEPMIAANGLDLRLNSVSDKAAAVEIGLVTEDVPGLYAQATAAGAVPVQPPNTKPWGQVVAYVRDCDGILVELCSPMGV